MSVDTMNGYHKDAISSLPFKLIYRYSMIIWNNKEL